MATYPASSILATFKYSVPIIVIAVQTGLRERNKDLDSREQCLGTYSANKEIVPGPHENRCFVSLQPSVALMIIFNRY